MNRVSDIKDICKQCGNIFTCELTKQGHGIGQERNNVAKMIECQMEHGGKENEKK